MYQQQLQAFFLACQLNQAPASAKDWTQTVAPKTRYLGDFLILMSPIRGGQVLWAASLTDATTGQSGLRHVNLAH